MNPLRHILVIADPRMQHSPALKRAAELAHATGAELHIRIYDYHPGIAAVGLVRPEVMRLARHAYATRREHWLADGAAALRSEGVTAEARFVWGSPIEEQVASEVLALNPGLVIKDVGLDGFGLRLWLDAHENKLARICPAPLLLVQPMSQGLPRRVYAAVDTGRAHRGETSLCTRVVEQAAALVGQLGSSELHLVHAFPGALAMGWTGDTLPDAKVLESFESLRQERMAAFAQMADARGLSRSQRHFVDGLPAMILPQLATNPCRDLIVIGSIHREGLSRFMFGSTTEAVLASACCDVLIVKPADFREHAVRHAAPAIERAREPVAA